MESNSNIANPLLKSLKKTDIENLLIDNTLKSKNVKIYYVVDTFDVIEYCFPFYKNNNKQATVDYKTKLIAYDYLFYENDRKPVIPDEYLAELSSFKHFLKLETRKSMQSLKEIQELFSDKKEIKQKLDFFYTHITTFLAIKFDLLNPDALHRFDDILKKRINAFNISLDEKDDSDILLNVFYETKKSDLTTKIFEEYYDEIETSLLLSNPSIEESYRYLENTFKDIVVIDRLININKKLYEKYKNNELKDRYLFLYVSSTPTKSKTLFNLSTVLENLPDIYGQKKYNFLRNASQIYLQSISTFGVKEKQLENTIKFLNQILEGQITEELIEQKEKSKKLISKDFKKQRETTRSKFDLSSKVNKFYHNKNKLLELIKNFNINDSSFVKFQNFIKEVLDSKRFERKASQVFEYLHLHTANYDFQKRILDVSLENLKIVSINRGKDNVKSNFQHLPILLFYNHQKNLSNKEWKGFLEIISDFLTNPISEVEENTSKFLNAYNKVIKSIKNKRNISTFESTITLYYLSLLIPSITKKPNNSLNNHIDTEIQLIDKIEKFKEVLKYSFYRKRYNKETKSFYTFQEENLHEIEINYILIWLYRRQKYYSKSINLAKETLRKTNDPRIKHGLALSYLSFVDERHSIKKKDKLIVSENILIEVKTDYSKRIKKEDNILVRKTILAVLNSLCNLNLKLFKLTSNEEYIIKAYDFYREFDILFNNHINDHLNNFPAFCDTFAWLFSIKSEISLNKNHKEKAKMNFEKANEFWKVCEISNVYDGIDDKKIELKIAIRDIKERLDENN